MIGPPTRVCTCTRTCVYLRAVYPHGEEEADDDEDADGLGLTLALSGQAVLLLSQILLIPEGFTRYKSGFSH